jgi:hypothetical protein
MLRNQVDIIIAERRRNNTIALHDGDERRPTDVLGVMITALDLHNKPIFTDRQLIEHVGSSLFPLTNNNRCERCSLGCWSEIDTDIYGCRS